MDQLISVCKNENLEKPLISYYLQPYPYSDDNGVEDESYYDDAQMMNMSKDGVPFYLAARSSTPPTTCTTPGHTIKGGYTPSGKYKPATYSPQKADKRAGK
jgi:hypothetical protein